MEVVAAIVIATLVGPFLIGWWIGNPVFAAGAWAALGLTVLLMQFRVEDAKPGVFAWIVVSTVVSSAAAYYGGLRRERRGQERH